MENGVEAWAISASQYIQAAAKNVKEHLVKRDDGWWSLPTKAETPI